MEARTASPVVSTGATETDPGRTGDITAGADVSRVRRSGGERAQAAARPFALSRSEEYRYIRADLRRLLITAGSLLALMLVLLVVVDR